MPWDNSKLYKNWLAQSFYYTTHSTRMLAFAAGWSPAEEQNYYRRSLSHIREEQSHDLLAVKDLEHLGEKRENFMELESCRALWEPQFYKIQRNPKHLLGYILALEHLAVLTFPGMYELVLKKYGPEAIRFVKVHAEDDPDHVKEAVNQIESCTQGERVEIMKNFDQTCVLYKHLLNDIASLS